MTFAAPPGRRRAGLPSLGAVALSLLSLPLPATSADVAAADCEAATRPATRLITLGTGAGPMVRGRRSQPANVIIAGGVPYLVDAGDGVERQLFNAGIRPEAVRSVFVTHLHLDHTADLAHVVTFNWSSLRASRMQIFGPPGTRDLVRAGIDYLSIPAAIHAAQMPPAPPLRELAEVHEFDALKTPTVVYQDANVKVTAVENSHFDATRGRIPQQSYGEVRSYSYRFDTADRSIVFTGDTGPSQAVIELARGADVLVSEVMDLCTTLAYIRRGGASEAQLQPLTALMKHEHLVPEEVGRMAREAAVKMVVLTHLGLGLDDERDMSVYTAGMRGVYSGPVVVAQDLQEF